MKHLFLTVVFMIGVGFGAYGFLLFVFPMASYRLSPGNSIRPLDFVQAAKPKLFSFFTSPLDIQIRERSPITFLLAGYGGDPHDGSFLTDTLIVARLDPDSQKLVLLNIPRDYYYAGSKINNVYAQNRDMNALTSAASDVLGMPIDGWVNVDFAGFRELIDALGGVEVDVKQAFTDTNFPASDASWVNAGMITVQFEVGFQTMDGDRALTYARSRHSLEDGGDFNRSKRQFQILQAVYKKLIRLSAIGQIPELIKIYQSYMQTSMSLREQVAVLNYIRELSPTIDTRVLSTDNYLKSTMIGGGYMLLPKDPTLQDIRQFWLE